MEAIYQYAWLIPVLPLVGALVVGCGLVSFPEATNRLRQLNAVLIISLLGVSTALSFALLASQVQGHLPYRQMLEWATAGDFHLQMGFEVDPLAALMLVVVTTVALLVMIYTDGYMAEDPGYVRFYAYLSLFSSSMLGLVLSPNMVQVYVFWELVGMCSYLLIGFWYDRPAAAEACQKAFVVNRVGDFGLLLGILGLYWSTGSFEFDLTGARLADLVHAGDLSGLIAAGLAVLVFLGPVAKSAQFPLHVWLPDAMEGPTPISALIHAATMVAAGVFLIARMFPLFSSIPLAMEVIAWTGAFTAFLGATIAITQNDIKKGLAYSTMSQLGYMVMAMGAGAYSAGLFHLVTHAYFKAMLFLGSGAVIHGMEAVVGHNPASQDMRLMGGLRRYMPKTAFTFLIGVLAISGIPPLAGFWSKDEILGATYGASPWLWLVGWGTAGITAFYMFRMYFTTFEGKFRGDDTRLQAQVNQELGIHSHGDHHGHSHGHPHEAPWTMTLPLLILAVPSTLLGLVGTPFANYFEELIHTPGLESAAAEFEWSEFLTMAGSSVGIVLLGITLAVSMYLSRRLDPAAIAAKVPFLYRLSLRKWYFDELYDSLFVRNSRRLARQVLNLDARVVDGLVNLTGLVTLLTGQGLKYLENGRAQFYALIVFGMVLGFVVLSAVT